MKQTNPNRKSPCYSYQAQTLIIIIVLYQTPKTLLVSFIAASARTLQIRFCSPGASADDPLCDRHLRGDRGSSPQSAGLFPRAAHLGTISCCCSIEGAISPRRHPQATSRPRGPFDITSCFVTSVTLLLSVRSSIHNANR